MARETVEPVAAEASAEDRTGEPLSWVRRIFGESRPAPPPDLSRRTLVTLLGFLVAWRLAILVFSYAFDAVGAGSCGWGVGWPLNYSACWDTAWYQQIANHGYRAINGNVVSVAFFPLYPLLMHLVDVVLPGRDVLAGLVVGHLALVGAVIYIYRLVQLDFDEPVAWRTLYFLLIFPSAVFFSVAYPESLFLFTLAGTLYEARRGRWVRAGLFAACASATKLVGVLLPVPLLVEMIAQRAYPWRRSTALLGLALAPVGTLAYFSYLKLTFGSASVWFDAQRQGWYRDSFHPVLLMGVRRVLFGDMTDVLRYYPKAVTSLPSFWLVMDTTLLILAIVAGIILWLRVRPAYGAFVLAFAALWSFSGNPQSLNRFVVTLFPAFILLGRIRNEALRNAISVFFVLGLALTTYQFVNGRWAG